jgi:rubrerythrin
MRRRGLVRRMVAFTLEESMGLEMDFSKLKAHEVLDLAIYAEEEAKESYEHLAGLMEARKLPDIAAFFLRMAGLENLHREQILAERRRRFPDAAATLANRALWSIETGTLKAPNADLSLVDAFKLALEAEVRAYDYYTGALEYVTEPTTEKLFEALRQAEVEHQRLLRTELAKHTS